MNKQEAICEAYNCREGMRHDEAAHNYDHAADMADCEREENHLRSMAKGCRKTAQRKRQGKIPKDWQTG